MKILRCLVLIFVFISLLVSCTSSYNDTREVGERIADSLGDYVRIYYSLSDELEDEYMSSDLPISLYGDGVSLPSNYTLILSSRPDRILEIGVFLSPSRDRSLELADLFLLRIREVDKWTGASGEVMIVKNLVIYYVSDLDEDLRDLIESSV